jgi:MarR family transcriptional regulator, transcriptional regulator for hemolysin
VAPATSSGVQIRPVGVRSDLAKSGKQYRLLQSTLLAELDLHPGQDVLIWHLAQQPEAISAGALAARLGVEPPTVTRSLGRLERGGWIARNRPPDDHRTVLVSLTPRGRAVVARIEDVWRELAETACRGLDPGAQDTLLGLLERVRANLAARGPGEEPEEP